MPAESGSSPLAGTLDPGVVHLWTGDLDDPGLTSLPVRSILSAEELERAGRFRDETHRNRYARARALLRSVLGGYLGTSPASLRFEYGARGRPSLMTAAGAEPPPGFNISHSGAAFALAVSRAAVVGVDVEARRPLQDFRAIAQRYFAPQESACLAEISDEAAAREAFYECWTRKEAYLKAIGEGIAHGLDRTVVSFGPTSGEARVISMDGEEAAARRWTLLPFRLEHLDALGCVAIEERDGQLRSRAISELSALGGSS